MSADIGTQQISEALENSCNIADNQQQSDAPSNRSHRPKASSLPTSLVRTIHLADDGDDKTTISTTVILQLFSDRIFISVTQLSGKVGALLVCNVEESIIDNSTTYHVGTSLGGGGSGNGAEREAALREVFVRRLAERIVHHARRMAGVGEGTILGGAEDGAGPIPTLVVGLGLRRSKSGERMSVECFNAILDAAVGLYEEGWRLCHAGSMVGMEGPD